MRVLTSLPSCFFDCHYISYWKMARNPNVGGVERVGFTSLLHKNSQHNPLYWRKLTPRQSWCVYYRALAMLRRVSWCRHPANSFKNDLRTWYSPRKKNRKTCSCSNEFHWHDALYRAVWTTEWRVEWILFGVKLQCCTFGLQLWAHKVPLWHPFHWIGAAWFFCANLGYKTQLLKSLSLVALHLQQHVHA